MRVIVLFLGLAILMVAAYAMFLSDHAGFNRYAIFGSNGRIETGQKFGIAIGQDYHAVERRMRFLGFEESPVTKDGSCHGFDYPEYLKPNLWFDNSWRKGTICIVTSSSKVRYVSWSYGIVYP